MSKTANNNWGKAFWVDLAERTGATVVGGLLALLAITQSAIHGFTWPLFDATVLVPTAFSLLKGLAANLKDPQSGASIVDSPPGPQVNEPRHLKQ